MITSDFDRTRSPRRVQWMRFCSRNLSPDRYGRRRGKQVREPARGLRAARVGIIAQLLHVALVEQDHPLTLAGQRGVEGAPYRATDMGLE